MKTAIITAEIVCSITMLIIGYAIFTEKRKELAHHFFSGCIVSVLIILLSDALSYIVDGSQTYYYINYISNSLSLIVADFLMVFYSLYVWAIVNEKTHDGKFNKLYLVTVFSIIAFDFIFEIYGIASKSTFSIINYYFVAGPLYDVCFILQLSVLAVIMLYLIANIKIIGIKTLIIFCVYYFFPAVSIIAIIINPECSFICSSIAMSFLVIYIGIEKERESRDIILSKLVNLDILTNLNNRNTYEEKLNTYINSKEDKILGVIFCDLNRLKAVNDEQGHVAGDQYIIKFANILRECFKKQEIFRISGDEFVILLENVTESELETLYQKITNVSKNNNNIASCGKFLGHINEVIDIVRNAEKEMYEDKHNFYVITGLNRRTVSIDK